VIIFSSSFFVCVGWLLSLLIFRSLLSAFAQGHESPVDPQNRIEVMMCEIVSKVLLGFSGQCAMMLMAMKSAMIVAMVIVGTVNVATVIVALVIVGTVIVALVIVAIVIVVMVIVAMVTVAPVIETVKSEVAREDYGGKVLGVQ
jgi:hypothetical protein